MFAHTSRPVDAGCSGLRSRMRIGGTARPTRCCSCQSGRQQTSSSSTSRRAHLLQLGSLTAGIIAADTAAVGWPAAAAAAAASDPTASCTLQTSSTGLRWCDLVIGTGSRAIQGAFTKAHYTAKLGSTGRVFDSSYQRKTPLIFKVGEHELIEAIDIAILGAEDVAPMREGGKRLVVAPPGRMQRQGTKSLLWVVGLSEALEEAGEMSADGTPTSDLVFEVELLAKKKR